jgi:poly-gamma-glutamate synthesis protein (capsule biosynthesis protein)
VASVAALGLSLAGLGWVLFDTVWDGRAATGAIPPVAESPTPEPRPLRYAGTLPAGAAGLGLEPAGPAEAFDLAFEPAAPGAGVAARLFVPVTAPGAGVDALSREELVAALRGEAASWAALGGFDRPIEPAFLGAPAAAQGILAGLGAGPFDLSRFRFFATLDDLRAALALDSGMLAIVPFEALRPPMVALAVDGADPARGYGDPALWPLAERVAVRATSPAGEAARGAVERAMAVALPPVTRVVATGDILMSRCTLTAIRATGDWTSPLRSPVGDFLVAADIAVGSLDGSIQDIAEPFGCIRTTNLTSPPEVIAALTHAGFDVLTVATNHAFDCAAADCGPLAMLRTIELLRAAEIQPVGGGNNLAEALEPVILEVNGVRFGFLGFDDIAAEEIGATETAPGIAPLDDSYEDERATPPREPAFYKPAEMLHLTRFEAAIRALNERADVVIVLVQSGFEDMHEPSPRSLKALRAAADAGADLVVGNQAHWVQSIEVRGDAFIAYALGNFIFDQVWTPEHTQGYLLEATFHGAKLATIRMLPYQIEERFRPLFVEGETRLKVIGDVLGVSPP